MTLRMIGLAAAIALVPAFAMAQPTYNNVVGMHPNQAPQPNASHAAMGGAARDGCINVPGEMHNSSDCARINPWDFDPARNSFQTDLSGRPTGASENAERNAVIAANMGIPTPPPREYDREYYSPLE